MPAYCNLKAVVATFVTMQAVYLLVTVLNQDRNYSRKLAQSTPGPAEILYNETVDYFLSEYRQYCEENLIPWKSDVSSSVVSAQVELCPCIPEGLVGGYNATPVVDAVESLGELELQHLELSPGGMWMPTSCVARQRIAIIIPFRDREEHLRILLGVLHPMLQRQMLHYNVYVVEQAEPVVFNKASLMNVGFVVARSQANYDCYIFHDVDMLPEDDRNFYTCSEVPRHVGSHLSKWNYRVPYEGLFGGVTAFTGDHFELVNGFSNQYYGWGGEDDDMYNRILAKNLTITRFSGHVARFTMIKHKSDVGNPSSPYRNIAFRFRPKVYKFDGLNSLRYQMVSYEERPLYKWIYVKLPPHPMYFRGSYRALESSASRNCCALTCILFLYGICLAAVIAW